MWALLIAFSGGACFLSLSPSSCSLPLSLSLFLSLLMFSPSLSLSPLTFSPTNFLSPSLFISLSSPFFPFSLSVSVSLILFPFSFSFSLSNWYLSPETQGKHEAAAGTLLYLEELLLPTMHCWSGDNRSLEMATQRQYLLNPSLHSAWAWQPSVSHGIRFVAFTT